MDKVKNTIIDILIHMDTNNPECGVEAVASIMDIPEIEKGLELYEAYEKGKITELDEDQSYPKTEWDLHSEIYKQTHWQPDEDRLIKQSFEAMRKANFRRIKLVK